MQRSSPQRFGWFSPRGSNRWSWWLLLAVLTALALYAAVFRVKRAVAAVAPGKLILAGAKVSQTHGRSKGAELDDDRMARLGHNLREAIHHAPARMAAVYVEDIETGASTGANADRPFIAASLIKVPVMATTYALWQDRPQRKTPAARWWMEQMITVSDNACTDRLIDLVGGPEVVVSASGAAGTA